MTEGVSISPPQGRLDDPGEAPTDAYGGVIGRWPDPQSDRALLWALSAGEPARLRRVVRGLCESPEFRSRPLADLLPDLGRIRRVDLLEELGTRSSNTLRRSGLATWQTLGLVSPADLSGLKNFGRHSLDEVLVRAVRCWALHHLEGDASVGSPAPEPVAAEADEVVAVRRRPAAQGEAVAALQRLLTVAWCEHGASSVADALDDLLGGRRRLGLDDEAHLHLLLGTDLTDLLDLPGADEAAWQSLFDMPERELQILRTRSYAADTPATLEELGILMGVTRERIRQLEIKATGHVKDRFHGPAGAGLQHLAARVRREIGGICLQDEVRRAVAAAVHATGAGEIDPLRERVLLALLGDYRTIGDMFMPARSAEILERARLFAGEAPFAPLPPNWFADLLDLLGAGERLRERIVQHLRVREVEDQVIPWRGSLVDKAVAILACRGEPMAFMEIHDAVGFDANPRSLSGQIQGDPRLIRRGKERYGLREWGGEEYTGIADEVEQAIERAGGRIALSALVTELVEQFGVSESSVRTYAGDRRFVRNGDGTVSIRGAEHPEVRYRRPPEGHERGVFRLDGVWHLRLTIDSELLRGSGRPIRNGTAFAAGLEPDLIFPVAFEGGDVTLSWRQSQPNMGSVRAVAMSRGLSEGDLLFLPLTGEEPRPVRTARRIDLERVHGLDLLLARMGIERRDDDALPDVVRALDLHDGADWEDVVDRLALRGEDELVEILRTVRP